jgi:hypothetical protein
MEDKEGFHAALVDARREWTDSRPEAGAHQRGLLHHSLYVIACKFGSKFLNGTKKEVFALSPADVKEFFSFAREPPHRRRSSNDAPTSSPADTWRFAISFAPTRRGREMQEKLLSELSADPNTLTSGLWAISRDEVRIDRLTRDVIRLDLSAQPQ